MASPWPSACPESGPDRAERGLSRDQGRQVGAPAVSAIDIVVDRWGARFQNRRFPCAIGRGGITTRKREGDGATPAGEHHFVGLLYRPDRLAASQLPDWALPIGPSDLWSDDPRDPDYNLMVRAPHPYGQERLRRPDPLYDLILLTDWNWPRAIPARGRRSSCTTGASRATPLRLRRLRAAGPALDRAPHSAPDPPDRARLTPFQTALDAVAWRHKRGETSHAQGAVHA